MVVILSLLFISAIIGTAVYLKQGAPSGAISASGIPVSSVVQTSTPSVVSSVGICPSDTTQDGQVRYKNTAQSTNSYRADVVSFFIPKTSGIARVAAGNTSATAFSTAVSLPCNDVNEVTWQVESVTKRIVAGNDGSTSVVYPSVISSSAGLVQLTLEGKGTDILRGTIKNKANQDKFLNQTSIISADGDMRGYVALNGTWTDTPDQTSLTIGTDGYFDLEVAVKTNNTKTQFGEDGLRTIVAIDADVGDWAVPSLSGAGITEISRSDLQSNDQTALSNYEYFYTIAPIKDTDTIIRWYQTSKSNINPSQDPLIRFMAEGRYDSVESTDATKVGIFTDASAQLEVATTRRQEMRIDIT